MNPNFLLKQQISEGFFTALCTTSNKDYSLEFKKRYSELYYYLLHNSDSLDKSIIKDGCSNLLLELEKLEKVNRNTMYDIMFIVSICSIFCDDIDYTIIDKKFNGLKGKVVTEQINFTDKKTLDKSIFFLEDCYTDNIKLFYGEYANLVATNKSSFFYKSNLVNIALLLKCYHYKCLDSRKIEQNFGRIIIINEPTFGKSTIELCRLLLASYFSFNLYFIKQFYIAYINFYFDYIFDRSSNARYSVYKFNIINMIIQKTIYPYLSCNLVSNIKFFNFEGTRIIISHIGMNNKSDSVHSIAMINHDWGEVHEQFNNKSTISDIQLGEIQTFLYKLYEQIEPKTREKIINLLWICYYEHKKTPLVNTFIKLIGELQFLKYFIKFDFSNKEELISARVIFFHDILDYYIKSQKIVTLDSYKIFLDYSNKDCTKLFDIISPNIDDNYKEIIRKILTDENFIIDIEKDIITESHLALCKKIREISNDEDKEYNHTNYDINFFYTFYKFMIVNFPPVNKILQSNVEKILIYFKSLSEEQELAKLEELALEAPVLKASELEKPALEAPLLKSSLLKESASEEPALEDLVQVLEKVPSDNHNIKKLYEGGSNKYKYIQLKKYFNI